MILMEIEVFHDYTLQFVNVPLGILKSIYHSLVYPYLYYGNICWGSTYSTRLDSIRKIQEKIIRLSMFAEYKEHTTPLYIRLTKLQLDDINLQVTALFMFRFFNNTLPDSFNDYFMVNRELHHFIITLGYQFVCIKIMLELIIVNIWSIIEELIHGIIYQSH